MKTVVADIAAARVKLAKRATFEAAVSDLCAIADNHKAISGADAQQELWGACCRAHQLLKSRYSSHPFWKAGQRLFISAQYLSIASERKTEIETWLSDSQDALGEESAEQSFAPAPVADWQASAAALASAQLFEGQLTAEQPTPLQPTGQHDQLLQALLSQLMAGAPPSAEEPPNVEVDAAAQLPEALQQLLAPYDGTEDSEGLAAALLASMAENQGANSRPAAAKGAVRSLLREILTGERLEELGNDVQCSVCRDELRVGDKVTVMPCTSSHVFHPQCLEPWLEQHNSCPVCRYELPTDDQHYENKKERDAEEAVLSRGAANALSHNEFMYS